MSLYYYVNCQRYRMNESQIHLNFKAELSDHEYRHRYNFMLCSKIQNYFEKGRNCNFLFITQFFSTATLYYIKRSNFANHPKLCGNCAFPHNFLPWVLGEISVFYAVLFFVCHFYFFRGYGNFPAFSS